RDEPGLALRSENAANPRPGPQHSGNAAPAPCGDIADKWSPDRAAAWVAAGWAERVPSRAPDAAYPARFRPGTAAVRSTPHTGSPPAHTYRRRARYLGSGLRLARVPCS